MVKYPPWQSIYLSFFSKELYRQVAKSWGGIAFQYLFLLTLFSTTVMSLYIYWVVDAAVRGPFHEMAVKAPKVNISADGVMTIDKKSPYEVSFSQRNSDGSTITATTPTLYFDATTDDVNPDVKAPFIFLKHKMCMGSGEKLQAFDWSQWSNSSFDQGKILAFLDAVKLWLPVAVFFMLLSFLFPFCAIGTLIWALVGLAVAGLADVKLSYAELMRLAVVASTPGVLLESLARIFLPGVAFWLAMIITLGYFIFAILANKDSESAAISVPPASDI